MRRLAIAMILCLALQVAEAKSVVNVAAAANVRDAMEQIKGEYERANADVVVNITYGASGVLMQQIMNGANFGLYLSADEEFAKRLKREGFGEGEVIPYAVGQLALYSRSIDLSKEGLAVLSRGDVRRIAVANPKVATYGTRAVELLVARGLYEGLKSKLIFGANISAAAQYVFTENAEVGFVALSQIRSPKAEVGGYSYIIPKGYYEPIVQSCVLVKGASAEAAKFRDYMLSEASKTVWRAYGYE